MPRLRRPRSPVHLLRQVAAGLLAVLALVLALRPPAGAPAGPAAASTSAVTVAATDLPAGTELAIDHLRVVELPTASVAEGVVADPTGLAGRLLAAPVRRGEPVTDVRLVGPGLWSQLPPGEVAAPVRLADLAVADLLRAGDRVDVLATATSSGPGEEAAVTVVATGALVLSAPPAATAGAPPVPAAEGSGLLLLAVPTDTAARLAGASASATLTVTLGAP
jgi:Flp pilus assembly protein CpaB